MDLSAKCLRGNAVIDLSAYDELCAYTLELSDKNFIHQHVVDAHAAQTASVTSKPIGVFFAVAGLFLHVELGFDGRAVQRAHMQLARRKREWPNIELPAQRCSITAADVLISEPGEARIERIDEWCRCVWEPFSGQRDKISSILAAADIV